MPQVNEFSWLFCSFSFFLSFLIIFFLLHFMASYSVISVKNITFYNLKIF